MTSSHVERELKFDVEPGFVLPDLIPALPPGASYESSTHRLRSEYFDTVDHDLLRARMTLRRRTGTTDVGWQLKIPHEAFREEIVVDAVGDDVPDELRRLLVGVSRGQELVLIATLSTERSVTGLVDAHGRTLAEIDDDTVHASATGDPVATLSSWREVEIELAGEDLELLHALGTRLRRAGARRSRSGSKLARALPDAVDDTRSDPRAGDVITAYIAEQQRVILAGDLALRRDDASVIHRTRVATRRLRSTLRVFGPLVEPARAEELDAQLRWYAELLGQVRDRQVLQRRLDAMIAEVDDALLLGPVQARVHAELQREQAEHWNRLQQELDGERYLALLADLSRWVREPPLTPAAGRPAWTVTKLVTRADRQVTRRLRRANATGDVHLLHQARKAAKRARYAAEAAEPVLGGRAAAEAKKYQRLQDLLGEHQDSVVSAEFLRRLGASAGTVPGENGFAFGVLHEREERKAHAARAKARTIAKRFG